MLKKILIAVAVIIVLLVIVIAIQPSEFRVTRSAKIGAPADVVFAQVNDFHNWEAWSPWAKLDPAVKNTFEGASSGKGAIFAWAGNDKVGEGRMTLTESHPNDLIQIRLEFKKPFEDTATAEFTFKPEGEQTSVTWSMFGKNSFMGKAVGLVMNMDKVLGTDFEKGLAQMKTVAESASKK